MVLNSNLQSLFYLNYSAQSYAFSMQNHGGARCPVPIQCTLLVGVRGRRRPCSVIDSRDIDCFCLLLSHMNFLRRACESWSDTRWNFNFFLFILEFAHENSYLTFERLDSSGICLILYKVNVPKNFKLICPWKIYSKLIFWS